MRDALHAFAVALLAAIALALAGVAQAADEGLFVPADAQVVAGPTSSGERLVAWVRSEGRVCTMLGGGRDDDDFVIGEPPIDDCTDPPALVPLGHESSGAGELTAAYGFAGRDVASVRLATQDGRTLAEAPTTVGTGPLAGVRFYLVTVPAAHPEPAELHLLDATGTVRRAEDLGGPPQDGALPIAPPAHVAGGRGARRWRAVLWGQWRLAPTPLEPTRHDITSCVSFTLPARPNDRSSVCDGGATQSDLLMLSPTRGCARKGTLLPMLVRPNVPRVRVVLTDGRRLRVPVRSAPGVAHWRIAFVAVPGAYGVRRVEGMDSDGRRIVSQEVGFGPATDLCSDGEYRGVEDEDAGSPDRDAKAPPTAHGEVVAIDRADELCIGVTAEEATSCRLPPVEPEDSWTISRYGGEAPVVLAIVPSEVAHVIAIRDDGQRDEAVAAPLPASYPGRYRETTRIARFDLPAGRVAVRFELQDATGRRLGDALSGDSPHLSGATRLLPATTGPSLQAAIQDVPDVDYGSGIMIRYGCLAAGTVTDDTCRSFFLREFLVQVQCAPRRTLILGLTPRPSDRLTLRTADGSAIVGRTVAIPRPMRPPFRLLRGLRGGATLLTAPASAAPRRLVLSERGRRPQRVALPLPPAAKQCGYALDITLRPFGGGPDD